MTVREGEGMLSDKAKEERNRFLDDCKGKDRNQRMENIVEAVHCGHYGAYADYLKKQKEMALLGPTATL